MVTTYTHEHGSFTGLLLKETRFLCYDGLFYWLSSIISSMDATDVNTSLIDERKIVEGWEVHTSRYVNCIEILAIDSSR